MFKLSVAAVFLLLTAFEAADRDNRTSFLLKEEAIFIEYTPAEGDAVIVVEAESESGLGKIEVRDPRGMRVLNMRAGAGQDVTAISGFVVESRESDLPTVMRTYRAGMYDLRARTVDGQEAFGQARLSHYLLAEPAVIYPVAGAKNIPTNLTIGWIPDPEAVSYRVNLEQGDSDTLQVMLPAGSQSLRVPEGVLAPGTDSFVEVVAVSPSGNRTVVEVAFTTRP